MIFDKVKDLIGKPYRKENEPRGEGKFDCWDIVVEVYKRCGIELPSWEVCHSDVFISTKIEDERKNIGTRWIKLNEINPPAPSIIVFKQYGVCNHVGVYIGEGMFIHAGEKTGVTLDRIDHILWKRRIEGFYTIKEG